MTPRIFTLQHLLNNTLLLHRNTHGKVILYNIILRIIFIEYILFDHITIILLTQN